MDEVIYTNAQLMQGIENGISNIGVKYKDDPVIFNTMVAAQTLLSSLGLRIGVETEGTAQLKQMGFNDFR